MTEEKENQKTFGISKKKRQFNNLLPHSVVAHVVKNLSAMQETQVLSLVQENSLEKGIPVFLAREFHGQRSLLGLLSMGLQSRTTLTHICVCVCVCVCTL